MHFLKKFKKVIRETGSHLIIGLDTDLNRIPIFMRDKPGPLAAFNRLVIEATKDLVCGYKINIAFYERHKEAGWSALAETLGFIPQSLITIADAKRGDIENTSELYAQAFFDELGFDSITVHPYMGEDSVRPFLRRKNKFVFLLVLTSNYGSKDFQFLKIGHQKNAKYLYEIVIEKAQKWNSEKIGFVIGASHSRELKSITAKYPGTPVLIPGIGAQKNSLQRTVSSLAHRDFVINQSRSILYSSPKAQNEQELFDAVRQSAMNAKNEINYLIKDQRSNTKSTD